MTASDWLVRALARCAGHAHLFGVGGANIEDVYNAAVDAGLLPRVCTHEFAAATMADGFARVSGAPAVVLATSGGGALNLVPALGESLASRVPVLAIVGQPALALDGTGAFQETSGRGGTFDLADVFRPVSRYCRRVRHVEELPEAVRDAFEAACSTPSGPAVLLIPKDVQQADASGLGSIVPPLAARCGSAPVAPLIPSGSRTLILAGEGVCRSGASETLRRYAERTDARLLVTVEAKEVCPADHPCFAGITGVMGHPAARRAVREAECVIVIGTRLPAADRYGIAGELAQARVIHLHDEPPFVPGAHWTHVTIDAGEAVRRWFTAETAFSTAARGWSPASDLLEGDVAGPLESSTLRLADLAPALGPLGDGRPLCWVLDAGNAVAALARDLRLSPGSRFLMALGMGGMGYSFGAGIGACLASGLPTVIFAGDGAFHMHGAEIRTAVEARLPLLVILADNAGHAMCTTRDRIYFGRPASHALHRFDGHRLAEGLAALHPSLHVEAAATRAALDGAVARLGRFAGPAALVLALDPDDLPPFQPFVDAIDASLAAR